MSKLGGYTGNILKVDLTTKNITTTPLLPELAKKFIGGSGINARLAYEHIKPHVEPLSPENALIFGAGPLVGTLAPGAPKTNLYAKSALSRLHGRSGSGHLEMIKFAGYDHIVITGKADSPVYLEIGDEVRIRDAGHVWGKDIWEATDAIWNELGRKYQVAAIGPAGENLVRHACIITNKYSAFGRNGMGAVMGSKNLKAIAAYGKKGITVADPQRFIDLANRMCRESMSMPFIQDFRKWGTLSFIRPFSELGITYRNWERAMLPEEVLEKFDLKLLEEIMGWHGNVSCMSCPVGCKHSFCLKQGPYAGLTMSLSCLLVWMLPFGCRGADTEGWSGVLRCAELGNRLGLDAEIGSFIAAAIDLYQRGIITKSDTGGLELDWNSQTAQELIQSISYRKGFGDILADGAVEAARRLGRGTDYYFVHFKGLNPIPLDPRLYSIMCGTLQVTSIDGRATSTNLSISNEGLSREELRSELNLIGAPISAVNRILSGGTGTTGVLTKVAEDYSFALECLGVCMWDPFSRLGINAWADLYSAATGIEIDAAGVLEGAARGWDMYKACNIREGASRKIDVMPERFLSEAVKFGEKLHPPVDRARVDAIVTEYYRERGWDPKEGTVSPQRLAELTQ